MCSELEEKNKQFFFNCKVYDIFLISENEFHIQNAQKQRLHKNLNYYLETKKVTKFLFPPLTMMSLEIK